jgi:phenylpyruvate tautomerase PptA (4-oxalocrotonate tautomerase family)
MPYLTIYTNVKFDNGEKIAQEASALTAKVLSKPESYVVTNIVYNENMAFGGKQQNKGALVDLKSIGLGAKDKFVSEMTAFLATRLNINNEQYIVMALTDAPAAYTACGGSTFA